MFIAAHGGTAFSTAFSFVCWLYNNNMVAGGSRCSAIWTIFLSFEPGLCTGLVKNVSTVQQDSIVVPIRLMTNGADVVVLHFEWWFVWGSKDVWTNASLKCIASNSHVVSQSWDMEAGASIKGIQSNGSHTIWNSNLLETGASKKGRISNLGHTIWNSNLLQTCAPQKGIISNGGDIISKKVHCLQAGAFLKGRNSNEGHTVRNSNLL